MTRNKRILVMGEGISLAHVTRALIAARALRERGHEVHLATSQRFHAWVAAQGWQARVVATADGDQVYDRLRHLLPMYTADEIVAATRDDLKLIDELAPDAVLADCRCSARLASAISSTPFVGMFNANCCRHYAGVQNTPLAFPPNRLLGKSNVDRFINPWLGPLVRPAVCRKLARPYDDAATQLGLASSGTDFRDVFTSDRLNLLTDLPELGPLSGAPDTYKHVGPMYWDEPADADDPTHALVAALPTDQPIIYITLGSSGNASMLPAIATALEHCRATFVVSGSTAADLPANFVTATFVNARLLLPRCAAVICHGGNGSIYQALAYDLPTISVPSFFDQEAHADQSVVAGFGIRVDLPHIARRMGDALDAALNDSILRRRAAELGAVVRASQPGRLVVDAIEQTFSAPTSRPQVMEAAR